MIDRDILKQMGFRLGTGFDHEVWYHDSECWVHYGNDQSFERYAAYGTNYVNFNGDADTMEHFFEQFIENVTTGASFVGYDY